MASTRLILLLLALSGVSSFAPLPCALSPSGGRNLNACAAASLSMMAQSKLAKTLNKIALTVSIDVPAGDEKLSKKLRKTGIAALFTSMELLPTLAAEQQKAKSDFPGPAPVILRDPAQLSDDSLRAARTAGASGVVLPVGALGVDGAKALAATAAEVGLEALWEVTSQEEYGAATAAGAEAFLVSCVEESFGVAPAFWEGLPKGKDAKVVVAEIKALQEGNSEIELGRTLGSVGCRAVLLSGALESAAAGQKEEEAAMWYVEEAFKALRSKASTKIQIGALMGQASMVGLVGKHPDYDHGSTATPPPTIAKKQIRSYD